MRVPSYDDLTPSIPDVHPRDTFDQVTRLVPLGGPVVEGTAPETHTRGLFACVIGKHPAALLALARDFSPRIERHGETCIVLDIAGLGRLLGDAEGIASELLRTAVERGIKGSIAVAPTQTAARLLARANVEVTVVTGDVGAAVAPFPLELLAGLVAPEGPAALKGCATTAALKGCATSEAAPRVFDILRRWGLRTIGEFAALPAGDVAARFGQQGVALQRLGRGLDPRPLLPDPGIPRFLQTMELEWPIEELEPLSFVFARLLDPLEASLQRADRAGAAIRVDLRLVNRTVHTRLLQLPAPIRDARVLRTLLLLDLESHPPSAGIDVVTIEVDPAPSRIVQFSLLERATPSPETIATLTARLNALVGEANCGSPVLLDSHAPDAFEMQRFSPERRAPSPESRAPSPEHRLRRHRPPAAIRVRVERGRPAHIPIDRKGMPGGAVTQAAGPWRSSGEWWTRDGHWDRDEWDVSLSDGSVCRIYCDRVTGRWFLDGVID